MKISGLTLLLLIAACCPILFFTSPASAQRRDYLTDAEIELVRDAQEIDLRIGVLTRALERRIAVLNNVATTTSKEKDADKWGEAPKGTRQQLVLDIERILQKAIDDIDEVATRNMDSKLFPKAMHKLTASCREYIPQFKSLFDRAGDEKEKGALLGAMENCNAVIDASFKVPKEPAKEEKKKKN